ncbi:MAG: hypothetical protein HZC47_00895 [Methanobacterium sp.]|uniref:hypothetical protein n=1 Tax=Methanobacterium sp. TaxID=2164 RepID=UPI003D65DF00|nr:hypothetical protein [Methanobacterium sp.]
MNTKNIIMIIGLILLLTFSFGCTSQSNNQTSSSGVKEQVVGVITFTADSNVSPNGLVASNGVKVISTNGETLSREVKAFSLPDNTQKVIIEYYNVSALPNLNGTIYISTNEKALPADQNVTTDQPLLGNMIDESPQVFRDFVLFNGTLPDGKFELNAIGAKSVYLESRCAKGTFKVIAVLK